LTGGDDADGLQPGDVFQVYAAELVRLEGPAGLCNPPLPDLARQPRQRLVRRERVIERQAVHPLLDRPGTQGLHVVLEFLLPGSL